MSMSTPGALLLCRAAPESVAAIAPLLRAPLLVAPAGEEWSVLVPEDGPWALHDEPVDRVLTGWASALAVGAPWPVLALWWDEDRAGFTLASGFRRPVGYIWLGDGTPVGEDEAMHTFAARLGLDPVLDMEALDALTEPDPDADAPARLTGLLAVLTHAGVALPDGLAPGEPADRLHAVVRAHPGAHPVERAGWRETVRAELDAVDVGRLSPWFPWSGTPQARALHLAQLAGGVPATVWGLHRRSPGWLIAGAVLLAHGTLGLAFDVTRPRD